MEKTDACATAFSQKGIKKKRGRKEIIISEREAVTAYRRLSVYRISGTFEQPMTQIRTICNKFMNWWRAATVDTLLTQVVVDTLLGSLGIALAVRVGALLFGVPPLSTRY